MAVLMQERSARRGSTGFRETDPVEFVPPGKTHSLSPSWLGYHERAGARGVEALLPSENLCELIVKCYHVPTSRGEIRR